MNTGTVIFQEQKDGTYKGIRVQSGGYIEDIGQMLYKFFRNIDETAEIIAREQKIYALNRPQHAGRRFENKEGWKMYKKGVQVYDRRYEPRIYYTADTLSDIRNFDYQIHVDKQERTYCHSNSGFIQKRKPESDTFLYVQAKTGEWLVSRSGRKGAGYAMCPFEPLADYFTEADNA